MDTFMKFVSESGYGPRPGPDRTNPGRPAPNRGPRDDRDEADALNLLMLLLQMQQGADAGMPNRMGGPPLAPPGGATLPFAMTPDAGDVADYNVSNGDPALMSLFGSAPPPLRQPPPGVSKRRGY